MATSGTPDRHIQAAKRRLCHLSGLSGRVDEAERRILEAANDRLGTVQAELEQLRPRVNLDPAAAEQYQAHTLEVGQLRQVIARAENLV